MTFFDTYSYKQKNYALIVLSVLLIAVAYKRAFSVSIETKNYRNELQTRLDRAENADVFIRTKQKEIIVLNSFLGKENSTIEKVQQGFLNFFARNGENLIVHQIDEVLNYKHPDFEINSHRVVLKGSYLDALNFIYSLEKDFELAKILTITFDFKQQNTNESGDLFITLLIQNYLRKT